MDSTEVRSAGEVEAVSDSCAAEYASDSHLTQRDIPQYIELADLQPGERVLDLGCGNAAMAIAAMAIAAMAIAAKIKVGTGLVVGIDISAQMLRLAHRRVADAGLEGQVELLKGNAEDLSALAASNNWQGFDVILCRRLICNLADRQVAALRHIASFLAPGGRIVVDQCYPYRFLASVSNRVACSGFRIGITAYWRKIEEHFREQVQKAGLRLDTVQDLNQNGTDVSAEIFEKAQEKWTRNGKTSKVKGYFLENCQKAWLEQYLARNDLTPADFDLEIAAILCLLRQA